MIIVEFMEGGGGVVFEMGWVLIWGKVGCVCGLFCLLNELV